MILDVSPFQKLKGEMQWLRHFFRKNHRANDPVAQTGRQAVVQFAS